MGPRGTGKSTWIDQHFSEDQEIHLLDGGTFQELSSNPSRLTERVNAVKKNWVVIDEIQKIPELLD